MDFREHLEDHIHPEVSYVVLVGTFSVFELRNTFFELLFGICLDVVESGSPVTKPLECFIISALDLKLLNFPGVEFSPRFQDHPLENQHRFQKEDWDGWLVVKTLDNRDHHVPRNQEFLEEGDEPLPSRLYYKSMNLLDSRTSFQVSVELHSRAVREGKHLTRGCHKTSQQRSRIFRLIAALFSNSAQRLGTLFTGTLLARYLS